MSLCAEQVKISSIGGNNDMFDNQQLNFRLISIRD